MNSIRRLAAGWVCLWISASTFAGQPVSPEEGAKAAGETSLSDLSISNLFTNGWNEQWSKRARADGAPDMALLRVQTNFLVRVLRADYYFDRRPSNSKVRDVQFLQEFAEYAFSRRFQIALISNYEWLNARAGRDESGSGGGALARFQLVDTEAASYALNFRVALPNQAIGERDTTASIALAGWHDLTPLGLRRVGFYWHLQEETLAGPAAPGAKRYDFTGDVTLAKTWTSPSAFIGNFSTFVEAYGKTDVDGNRAGTIAASLTPGLRFTLGHRHVIMCGVDLPVTQPRSFEKIWRFTYIYNF